VKKFALAICAICLCVCFISWAKSVIINYTTRTTCVCIEGCYWINCHSFNRIQLTGSSITSKTNSARVQVEVERKTRSRRRKLDQLENCYNNFICTITTAINFLYAKLNYQLNSITNLITNLNFFVWPWSLINKVVTDTKTVIGGVKVYQLRFHQRVFIFILYVYPYQHQHKCQYYELLTQIVLFQTLKCHQTTTIITIIIIITIIKTTTTTTTTNGTHCHHFYFHLQQRHHLHLWKT